jgi:hypothetical protein
MENDPFESNIHHGLNNNDVAVPIDTSKRPTIRRTATEDRAVKLVSDKLASLTSGLLSCMRESLATCDAVLMDMSGYRKYLGPPEAISSNILDALTKIRKKMIRYDEAEDSLMEDPALPPTYSDHPAVVELFLFVHPIRQAANSAEKLLVKVMEMQQRHPGWRIYPPLYPFSKSLQHTNQTVRHDRGGLTAGFYFRSQAQLARTMKGMANVYKPLPRQASDHPDINDSEFNIERTEPIGKYNDEDEEATREKRFRYRLWMILHRLQGFETRFALKVALVTGLLSIPAWLPQSRSWWNENESWWAVVTVWIMMHPRFATAKLTRGRPNNNSGSGVTSRILSPDVFVLFLVLYGAD